MNEDVKHKWRMLDKDVVAVLMSTNADYWILVKLDKIRVYEHSSSSFAVYGF